jgi:phosphoribosylformylglycinamidine synthase PurS subunit
MKARIYVTPRRDVLDPQGVAVRHALGSLGFEEADDVRVGKYIEIELSATDPEAVRTRVRDMCEKLLANTVIEDYRFEIAP